MDVPRKKDENRYVVDPYLPKEGYLELRPDRPGWGVEMDEQAMTEEGYIHWQRRVPKRPDGSVCLPLAVGGRSGTEASKSGASFPTVPIGAFGRARRNRQYLVHLR